MNFKIAVTNLGLYNEGELKFEWLELPSSEEELQELLERIGVDGERYEEYFISDYDADFDTASFGEYENFEHLNELAELLDSMDYDEYRAAQLLMSEAYCGSADVVLELLENFLRDGHIYYARSLEEFGEEWAEMCGLEIPDHFRCYIDWEAYGQDVLNDFDYYEDFESGFVVIL